MNIICIFGCSSLDNILIRIAADGVVSMLKTYQTLASQIESLCNSGNTQAVSTFLADARLVTASQTFLTVAIALSLRVLVRGPSENVINEITPGLST
jgi:hypothetical protein